MEFKEIMTQLQGLGLESIKKVLLKHNVKEPLYGVKIEELKKINKKVKTGGHELSLKLYDTGIYDAMYLAGLVAEPDKMSAKELQKWADNATCGALHEFTVAWSAAESKHALPLAQKWIDSKDPGIASAGWNTLSSYISITDNEELDIPFFKKLLDRAVKDIAKSPNRVKYTMNGYVIAVGSYIPALNEAAKQAAKKMGKVEVDMGDTACKIPDAITYIKKVEDKGYVGRKRKSARCL